MRYYFLTMKAPDNTAHACFLFKVNTIDTVRERAVKLAEYYSVHDCNTFEELQNACYVNITELQSKDVEKLFNNANEFGIYLGNTANEDDE